MLTGRKTMCLGRLLLDVPASFRLNPHPITNLQYAGADDPFGVSVQVMREHSDPESFDAAVSRRRNEMKKPEVLKSLYREKRESRGSIFLETYSVSPDLEFIDVELHSLIGSAHIAMKSPVSSLAQLTRMEEHLLELASRISSMAAGQSHESTGYCLGPVLINDPRILSESGTFVARSSGPDAAGFSLNLHTSSPGYGPGTESLRERLSMARQVMYGLKVLRSGEVSLLQRQGEEILLRYPSQAASETTYELSFSLWLRAPRLEWTPVIELQLNAGGQTGPSRPHDPMAFGFDGLHEGVGDATYYNPSLSDGEAIALWDSIKSSIRVRPGAYPER